MAKPVQEIIQEIQELFLSDSLPWIVGYSGGKDSTASLQLIWSAIAALPEDRRRFKPVYVISTDTLVENPVIAAWVELSLAKMKLAALDQKLPIVPTRLTPALENRFWVNLIGKGYPAPRPKFRWCTDRLKISASTKFIQELSEANGEAILVLGTRKGESAVRDKVIDNYKGSTRERLSRNADPKLSRVWVYPPIESWSSDDVWEYLIETPNNWGVNNQELFAIYRGATPDAECPIVVDKSTPSCGDSRFGCYVCTMVAQDKSMQAMILNDSAKSWMQPILDFRNKYLAVEGGDRHLRDFRRMNGKLILLNDRLVHGPYSQEYRAELLRKLLIAQRDANANARAQGASEIELIGLEELEEIRRQWVVGKGELEDLVPKIYQEVCGEVYEARDLDSSPFDESDLVMLREAAQEWIKAGNSTGESDQALEQTNELYKLTRTLLSSSFRGLQSRKRSKQLDELEEVLRDFSFTDESDALEFARKHLAKRDGTNSPAADPATELETLLQEVQDTGASNKVIPIHPQSSLLA
jgi:DNA sulfur modification protein DndC